MINEKQQKKLSRIFKITNQTFQELAFSAGLKNIPDHMTDLTEKQAKHILRTYSGILKITEDNNTNRNKL